MRHQSPGRQLAPFLPWLVLLPANAFAADSVMGADEVHWSLRADAENWRLPGDESMGVVRLGLRRAVTDWLSAGVDGSAAVRGSRGGFITLGFGAEALVPLSAHVAAEAGVSVQAGGGRGGYQLSGGGLMTRAALGLRYLVSRADVVSVGVSRVDFPEGGVIRSTQAYLAYGHAFSGWSLADRAEPGDVAPTALGSMPQRLGVYVEPLFVPSGHASLNGGPQGRFGLVGFEWRTTLHQGAYARFAAAGAASGSSSGYMQALAGLGYRWSVAERIDAFASASVGAGGGGGVDTGGGLLVEGAAGLDFAVTRHDALDVSASFLKAPSASFAARGITLGLLHRFGPDESEAATPPTWTDAYPVRVRAVEQEYSAASAAWSSRSNRHFGTLGVQADYFVTPSVFLTGQGLAAYRGENGAYMIGLVGAGWHQPLAAHAFVEVEGLVGAAGGGGAAVGSGVVGQANAALGWQFTDHLSAQLAVGRLQARRGGFAANVLGVSFAWQTRLLGAGG